MAIPMVYAGGAWEEIMRRLPNFAGQRLRIELYPVESTNETAEPAPYRTVLQEIAERTAQIASKPDTRDWSRRRNVQSASKCVPLEAIIG